MDLSRLKWPLIIVVVVGIGFLASSPGIDFMLNKFTEATPGQDAIRDRRDEAGLSRLAGYIFYQFRYQRALDIMQLSIDRYGSSGANYWYNKYRMAKCHEKMNHLQECYDILQELITANASEIDPRVAINDNLRLRATQLKEVNNLK